MKKGVLIKRVLLKHNFVEHSMYQYRRGKERVYIGINLSKSQSVPDNMWALTLCVDDVMMNFYDENKLDNHLIKQEREKKIERIMKCES